MAAADPALTSRLLAWARAQLRDPDAASDTLITDLINAATQEYIDYIDAGSDTAALASLTDAGANGIILLVQQDFDGDPLDRTRVRQSVLDIWRPARRESF